MATNIATGVDHTVEAEYGSITSAEQALSALEWAGIEAANVTLAGPAVERSFYRRDTQQRDGRMMRDILRRSVIGGTAGGALCLLAGGILGLFIGRAFGLSGYESWLTSGLGALLGGIIGVEAGAMIGAEVALNINEASEFKFDEDRHEPAIVRVQVRDEKTADRAEAILRAKRPVSMQHLLNGRPVRLAS
jgi:outer membrane lipoprotein SlyB